MTTLLIVPFPVISPVLMKLAALLTIPSAARSECAAGPW